MAKANDAGESIDYLTFVSDGEPTLDANLGVEIELLKSLGFPVAVITNASLLWRPEVRQDLMAADWVSVKVDTVEERIWRRIDRPHGSLKLVAILEGLQQFSVAYRGELVAETMLVAGVNDSQSQLKATADVVASLQPKRAYLSVPTRPPAETWVQPPTEQALHRAYRIFQDAMGKVEYLIGYEGNAFAFTGSVEQDLLSITAVHPMREDAVAEYLHRAEAGWPAVERLVAQGRLLKTNHEGHIYYLRRLGDRL